MILALEGIDGSGKTTLARLLHDRFENRGFPVRLSKYSHFEFDDPFVQAQMNKLRNIVWDPGNDEPESDLLGTHFYLFLLAAWSSVKQKHCIVRFEHSTEIAIFDGWHYRTILKAFIRQRLAKPWLHSLFSTVAKPDLVVLLDVDPSVAWNRRSCFKASELGRWDGFIGDDYSAYCGYQGLIRSELLLLAEELGWVVARQTKESDPTDVLNWVDSQVSSMLRGAQ